MEDRRAPASSSNDSVAPAELPRLTEAASEWRSFLVVLALVTVAFVWLLRPFWSALFWACALAVLFAPLKLRLTRFFGEGRSGLASMATLAVALVVVVGPLCLVVVSFFQEAVGVYQGIQCGAIDLHGYAEQIRQAFPAVQAAATRLGLDTSMLSEHISEAVMSAGRFLTQNAVRIGHDTLGLFIDFCLSLYMAFFMLRDGGALIKLLVRALPLGDLREQRLLATFADVIRATVKGNLFMAVLHGLVGGTLFVLLGLASPLLWGVIIGVMALVPLVGTGLVWAPVSLYLLASGDWIRALVLVGVEVAATIGFDNFLRPLLVGRSIQLPDYVVLLSTLGGFVLFGAGGMVVGPLVAGLFVASWRIFMGDLGVQGRR